MCRREANKSNAQTKFALLIPISTCPCQISIFSGSKIMVLIKNFTSKLWAKKFVLQILSAVSEFLYLRKYFLPIFIDYWYRETSHVRIYALRKIIWFSAYAVQLSLSQLEQMQRQMSDFYVYSIAAAQAETGMIFM